MKITITSPSHTHQQQPTPSRSNNIIQSNSTTRREERDQPYFTNCPGFVFGNCINQSSRRDTEQNEIVEECQEQTSSLKRRTVLERQSKLVASEQSRKHKICLSLKLKSQKNQTPKKQTNHSNQNKCYSEQKRECRQDSHRNPNVLTPTKRLDIQKHTKIKTDPVEQQSAHKNAQHLKESFKPSTNAMTPSKSLKQSHNSNSNSKKGKLTLSNNFKTSIIQQNIDLPGPGEESFLVIKKVETALASHQVFIEQSLMTQKMMNIYGERSESFMKQPSSNIVYYNQIMANQTIWKHPSVLNNQQNKVSGRAENSQREAQKQQKSTSILRGLYEHQQSYNQPEPHPGNKVDIREKFMERKYIGQYAKTIKTFNESEQKQENDSVVLEHGFPFHGHFPLFATNRGSIKDYPSESEVIRRQYSSFGEEQSSQLTKNRQYVSNPIEQNSYDSEKQN